MWQDVGDHDDAGRDLAGQQILHDGRRGAAQAAPDPRRQSGSSRPGTWRRIGRRLRGARAVRDVLAGQDHGDVGAICLGSFLAEERPIVLGHLPLVVWHAGHRTASVRQLHDFRGGRLVKLEQALSVRSRDVACWLLLSLQGVSLMGKRTEKARGRSRRNDVIEGKARLNSKSQAGLPLGTLRLQRPF